MSENSHGESAEIFGSPEKYSFLNYLQLFSSISINYVRQTADKLIILAVIYSVFSLLAYFLYLLIKTYVKDEHNDSMKRVLIVTAHPDDECMFFGPTIVNLRARNLPVHLLCLSPGDSEPNSRQVRKRELWESCNALGLDECLIELKKHTLLMDGHEHEWSHKLIASLILSHVEMLNIDTVITFDELGVSEHPNHIALFDAMAYLTLNHLLPTNVIFYSLDTVNRLRKYSFMLDFLTSFFLSELCVILSLKQQYQVVKAMSCHRSQFVWYRKLYILLSRYATINTLKTWTREELKYCVKYQELVDGMKYKNKWYESLDDSLKKINSEQTMQTLARSDDFADEDNVDSGEDDSDANVSFVAKVPSSEAFDSSPEPTVSEAASVRTESDVSTNKPVPTKLGHNESIHNGEVYVRKSRFLIPKTYGSFYNSSSSETSDERDDAEVSSSSNTSLDKILQTPNSISSEASGGRSQDTQSSEEVYQTPRSVSSEDARDTFNVKNTLSDVTLLHTDTDVTVDNEEENNLSYEIEDIESVLAEDDVDEDETYLGEDDKGKSIQGVIDNVDDLMVFDRENETKRAKELNNKEDSIVEYYDKEHDIIIENCATDSLGEKIPYRSECMKEREILDTSDDEAAGLTQIGAAAKLCVVADVHFESNRENNSLSQDSNMEVDGNKFERSANGSSKETHDSARQVEAVKQIQNNRTPALQTENNGEIPSSNSSEQESAIDEQTSDALNAETEANETSRKNKKKRRKRKNKKENSKELPNIDNGDKHAEDIGEALCSSKSSKQVFKRNNNNIENNNTVLDDQSLNKIEFVNRLSHEETSSKNKLSRSSVPTASCLGENNQNIFNVDNIVGNDDDDDEASTANATTTVLRPVSTN